MANSASYILEHREEIRAYHRAYYRANSTRPAMIQGASRQSKVCRMCATEKLRAEFCIRQSGSRAGHLTAHCKKCIAISTGIRKKRDPTIYRRTEWPSKLKRLYGITVDDFKRILASQGGGCGICGSKTPGGRKYVREGTPMFNVDHCHATGMVRGILCSPCNRALGLIRDKPEVALKMAKYLEIGRVS